MLEIIFANFVAPPQNLVRNVTSTVPVVWQTTERIDARERNQIADKLYLVKGKPYESDYSREAERDRRRHELENREYEDHRYYRNGDRPKSGEEYREERDRDYRWERRDRRRPNYDRNHRSRQSIEELLERRTEELERREDGFCCQGCISF